MLEADQHYVFTKNEDGYNKLPKGEKAILICITLKGEKIFFAEKEISIGQHEVEKMELKPATTATIKQRMKMLDQKPQQNAPLNTLSNLVTRLPLF